MGYEGGKILYETGYIYYSTEILRTAPTGCTRPTERQRFARNRKLILDFRFWILDSVVERAAVSQGLTGQWSR